MQNVFNVWLRKVIQFLFYYVFCKYNKGNVVIIWTFLKKGFISLNRVWNNIACAYEREIILKINCNVKLLLRISIERWTNYSLETFVQIRSVLNSVGLLLVIKSVLVFIIIKSCLNPFHLKWESALIINSKMATF